jgi:hypothetical protein
MNKRLTYTRALVRATLAATMCLPLLTLEIAAQDGGDQPASKTPPGPIRRTADGKPDLTGFYGSDAGGANYGLERHDRDFLTPGTRGVVVDPPDGKRAPGPEPSGSSGSFPIADTTIQPRTVSSRESRGRCTPHLRTRFSSRRGTS